MIMTKEEAVQVYDHLARLPKDFWRNGDKVKAENEIGQNLAEEVGIKISAKDATNVLFYMGKVAEECSKEEFIDCLSTGEMPAVKLTPEETETLKGGLDPVVGGIIIGGGLYGLFKIIDWGIYAACSDGACLS